jgi:hypothetical protein
MSQTSSATGQRAVTALLVCAVVDAIVAIVDLAMRPTYAGNHLHTAADYTFTALGLPFFLAALFLVASLRALHAGRDGRLGRIGFRLFAAGTAGLALSVPASLISANDRVLSPLYPLATLATFIGIVLFAVAMARASVLPRWAGPALGLGWIVAGPTAPGHGLFLVQTAICATLAFTLTRTLAREPEPAGHLA